MKKISVDELTPVKKLGKAIYHESGNMLIDEGRKLSEILIEIMKRCGIENVYEWTTTFDFQKFQEHSTHKIVRTENLPEGYVVEDPIYTQDFVLLIKEGVKITKRQKESLIRRGIREVFLKKTYSEMKIGQFNQFQEFAGKARRDQDFDIDKELPKDEKDYREDTATYRIRKSGDKLLERRKFKRYPAKFKTFFKKQILSSDYWSEEEYVADVQDLSQGGVRFVTAESLVKGGKIKLTLLLKKRRLKLQSIVEIVRARKIEDGSFEIGGKFIYLEGEKKEDS